MADVDSKTTYIDFKAIVAKARLFSDEIKNIDLYKTYAAARDEIAADSVLSAKLVEYKKLHADFCKRKLGTARFPLTTKR